MQIYKGLSSPKDADWLQEEINKKKKHNTKLEGVGCQNAFVNQALDLKLMPKDLKGSISSRSVISSFHIYASFRLRGGEKTGNLGHCLTLKVFKMIAGYFIFCENCQNCSSFHRSLEKLGFFFIHTNFTENASKLLVRCSPKTHVCLIPPPAMSTGCSEILPFYKKNY